MIEATITEPTGNRRALKSALNLADNTRRGVELSWFVIAKDLRSEFSRQVLSRNKTGRFYIRRDRLGRGRKHQASAPGETPANRTGTYRKAIDWLIRLNELVFGNNAEHAGFLELGTSRMKKRPGLGNTIKAGERDILRDLAQGVEGRL